MTAKNINKIIYASFILIILLGVCYFYSRHMYFADLERKLIPIHFVGRIDSMRDLNRGSYYLKVITKDSVIELQSLPLAYDINRTKLKISDSASKERNSYKIFFFRTDSGKRTEMFNYKIDR